MSTHTMESKQFGLLGRTLKHSYSVGIHAKLGEYPYALFEVEPEHVEHFIRHGKYAGINVTIPYKERALALADEVSEAAREIGAANVLIRREDGTLFADNTDYAGLKSLIAYADVNLEDKHVLILGAGGASKTAQYVAKEANASHVSVASRKGELTLSEAERLGDVDVVINATPVGMYPQVGVAAIDLATLKAASPKLSAVIDMVYNPARTRLIEDAESLGVRAVSGMRMLVEQARVAAELFTHRIIAGEVVDRIHDEMMHETLNIALIGMPTAGKSTVGRQLVHLMQRPLCDVDAAIVEHEQRSIGDIFSKEGEAHFREIEHNMLSPIAARSGQIIVCGGGVVEREDNLALLRQNSVIVFLNRDLSKLSLAARPLGKVATIESLAKRRMERYYSWADMVIDNDSCLHETAQKISDAFYRLSLVENK